MSSHLHIANKPHGDNDYVTYSETKVQLSTAEEAIYTINELEILLKATIIMRRMETRVISAQLDRVDRESSRNIILSRMSILSMEQARASLGYYGSKIHIDKRKMARDHNEYKQTMYKLRNAVKSKDADLHAFESETYNDIVSWAKENFVEGQMYMFTV